MVEFLNYYKRKEEGEIHFKDTYTNKLLLLLLCNLYISNVTRDFQSILTVFQATRELINYKVGLKHKPQLRNLVFLLHCGWNKKKQLNIQNRNLCIIKCRIFHVINTK